MNVITIEDGPAVFDEMIKNDYSHVQEPLNHTKLCNNRQTSHEDESWQMRIAQVLLLCRAVIFPYLTSHIL